MQLSIPSSELQANNCGGVVSFNTKRMTLEVGGFGY
jgi:hypothetical protein